jgi:hypothetical protein
MKNLKRILSLIGAILLFCMYASTLVFAFIDHTKSMWLFKASIACTLIFPILLYAYTLVFKITRHDQDQDDDDTQ